MFKYFLELRNKFILTIITLLSTLFFFYFYKDVLLFLVTQMHLDSNSFYFICTSVTELFTSYLRLIIFFSSQILLWYIGYHLLVFFSFGFYPFEFRVLHFLFVSTTLFWILSVLFTSYILIPFSWSFFLSFQDPKGFYLEARVTEYLDFFINVQFLSLFYFQCFNLVLFFLTRLQQTKYEFYHNRKFYYYLFLIFSTLITPPDLLSQLFTTLLMVLIYEIFLFCLFVKNLN
jgi:sec-independent protein translocase protein TatC